VNQDILRIRNVALISFSVLVVIQIICYFIFDLKGFLSILASGILTFLLFIGTLLVYTRIVKIQSKTTLSYLLIILLGKLIISAVAFYLVYRFNYLDMLYFLISYLIFFTVFFNIEIFLLYRKVLFYIN
jgi:hypothetical protein